MSTRTSLAKRLLVLPPLALGVAFVYWMISERQSPTTREAVETARSVRVMAAPAMDLVPTAIGYGSVEPARVWSAVAEVSGRIVEVHRELNNGEILAAGTILLRIDPVRYQLSLAQADAQLAELEVQESNTRASLGIEQRNLALVERELNRVSNLVAEGSLAQSEADAAERNVLAIRASIQNLRNTLSLIPIQQRAQKTLQAQAQRDLDHTVVRAPFDIRVADLSVEIDQYVSAGQKLFEGDSVDRVEVVAQVTMSALRNLIPRRPEMGLEPTRLNENLAPMLGLRPLIRLDLGGQDAVEWEAEFVRISDTIDPQTRTLGVIVAVDKPFELAIPGVRPPLSKGMFVQVLLRGRTQPGRILLPPTAVRDGTVLIADENDRLQRRTLSIAFEQPGLSVIEAGLREGERVVLSDPVPAVVGMLLRPVSDPAVLEALRRAAGAIE